MANKNTALNAAGKAKKDEFYTQLTDIEKGLRHYRAHFKGKTILCNCDDPFESNFFKYFVLNFNRLGLKKVIATCYAGSPIAGTQLTFFDLLDGKPAESEPPNRPYKAIVTTVYDKTGDGGVDMLDVAALFKSGENELTELLGDGDFRSPECLALLDEADIVVTNPPFSLFREFMAWLMESGKQFIIIGNMNAISYKEVFPLIKNNMMWMGATGSATDMVFGVPEGAAVSESDRAKAARMGYVGNYTRLGNSCWYTNIDHGRRHEPLRLMTMADNYKHSKHKELRERKQYYHYENYDAIEVPYTDAIPSDYEGAMGVPVTFLDKYCPEQFEIIGHPHGDYGLELGLKPFPRELKAQNKGLRDGDLYYINDEGKPELPYRRILIRHKQ